MTCKATYVNDRSDMLAELQRQPEVTASRTTAQYKAWKYSAGQLHQVQEVLSVEEALRITLNHQPFTITMRTPGAESELVRGLLFSEVVYSELEPDPVMSIEQRSGAGTITAVDVTIPPDKIGKGAGISRNILSVSSCGLCGKAELGFQPAGSPKREHRELLEAEQVAHLFEAMSAAQSTFKASGGCHGAAAFTLEGEMLAVQEDIGRHNAVDKVIGSLLLRRQLPRARSLVVSGRSSYEIVNKCAIAGIPFLAGVSAPSSLAVDLAEHLGITLLGFCRGAQFTVYANAARIKQDQGGL